MDSIFQAICLRMFCFALLFSAGMAEEPATRYRIYVDADQTHLREAGQSILNGLRTALSENDNQLGGFPIEILVKDHRRNTLRSQEHLQTFLEDPQGLLVIGGVHSPAILASQKWINQNGVLFLSPWAAAGPLTRASDGVTNWIFRVSIDDNKAGDFLVEHMHTKRGFAKPFLLLENTGWGDSNQNRIRTALASRSLRNAGLKRFPWHIGVAAAAQIADEIAKAKPDCILFIGNAPEGRTLFTQLLAHPDARSLPVLSHWGITAGSFWKDLPEGRSQFDLSFLQTSFSFTSFPSDPLGQAVIQHSRNTLPDVLIDNDMAAPSGFIHAFDIGRILIAAAQQAKLTGDAVSDRNRLRLALERLEVPVEGLVKTYNRPFAPWSPKDPDAHEALGPDEFAMGVFTPDGPIKLLNTSNEYERVHQP